jgi:hypothetical protein
MSNKEGLTRHNAQLTKQSSSISLEIPSLNKAQVKIYDIFTNQPPIREISTNDELAPLIDVIGKWRFYLGIKEEPSKQEMIINTNFVRENFGALRIGDIHEAINLSVAGKLDCDNEAYNNFSPLYIGRILNAYNEYRNQIIGQVKRQISIQESKKASELTQDEKNELWRTSFISAWNIVKSGGFFEDYGHSWYDYIKKNKLVTNSKELTENALEYAKKRVSEEKPNAKSLRDFVNEVHTPRVNEVEMKNRYARFYVVNYWLQNIQKGEEYVHQIKIDD